MPNHKITFVPSIMAEGGRLKDALRGDRSAIEPCEGTTPVALNHPTHSTNADPVKANARRPAGNISQPPRLNGKALNDAPGTETR